MSVIAIAVKHLIAAGVTGNALVTAIQEMEVALKPAKSTNAERQARFRARNKVTLRNVTNVTGVTNPPPFAPPSDGFPHPSLTPPLNTPPAKPKARVELPDWLQHEAWDGFVEMRVKAKKPMTDRSKRMAIKKLDGFREKGHDPTEILNRSTFNNYQDLYEPKEKEHENIRRGTTVLSKSERARAAIFESAVELGYAGKQS